MISRVAAVVAFILTAVVAVACTTAIHPRPRPAVPASAAVSSPGLPVPPVHPVALPAAGRVTAGVATRDLAAFGALCRCEPHLVARYIRWGETPRAAGLAVDLNLRAVPLTELQPYGVRLAAITAGTQDGYLREFAGQVKAMRVPLLMSFSPEVNNDSYPWGYRHDTPQAFIAAWRHVVTVFRQAGAVNVRWVLVVNYSSSRTEPLKLLWPGRGFVDMAGIDGYAQAPAVTFDTRFGATIAELRALRADLPVMIAETGANPAGGKARWMREVITGVRRHGLIAFVWFDRDQLTARGGNDWSIDKDPAALAAYRKAAAS